MKGIRVHQIGSPELLQWEDIPTPKPAPHQVLISLRSIGVNFIDIYFRKGFYKVDLPFTPGMEGAGVIEDLGGDVKEFKKGDRVAYVGPLGAYAQMAVVPMDRLVKIPEKISFEQAAAVLVQGMTAHYLTRSTYRLKKGDVCLVHAAAGGVGQLLCQVAKMVGAIVIGTVSTQEKSTLAMKAGADHVIIYSQQDFVTEVKRLTHNDGVHVVYDGVGADTFHKSLDCLRPRGMMVLFGQASGPVGPLDPNILNQKGSLFLTRPGINAYTASRRELLERATDLFGWLEKGSLLLSIGQQFPLEKAAFAHHALESRKTQGKLLLVP